MIAIDSNVLLRFFQHDNDAAQSARAQKAVKQHAPVFVNDVVLAEFVWTCKRTFKLDRIEIHKRLEAIGESTEFIVARPQVFERALRGYGARTSDFADWLIGEVNLEHGCEATLTFDTDAVKGRGFRLVAG